MCKMNQFFAVSSHTPLPATDTVINLYEIHTVGFSRHCLTLTPPTCDWEIHRTSATNHSWSRKLEAMKTHKHHTTGYEILQIHGKGEVGRAQSARHDSLN